MTGSSFPSLAAAVRSRPNFSSACTLSSGFCEVTLCGPRTSATAFSSEPRSGSRSATPEAESVSASSTCSVEMYSSPNLAISCSARCKVAMKAEEGRTSAVSLSFGSCSTAATARLAIAAGSAPSFCRIGTTSPSSWAQQGDQHVGWGHLRVLALGGEGLSARPPLPAT